MDMTTGLENLSEKFMFFFSYYAMVTKALDCSSGIACEQAIVKSSDKIMGYVGSGPLKS